MNNDLALAGKTKLKKMLVIEAVFTSLFADFTDFSFIYYCSWRWSKSDVIDGAHRSFFSKFQIFSFKF